MKNKEGRREKGCILTTRHEAEGRGGRAKEKSSLGSHSCVDEKALLRQTISPEPVVKYKLFEGRRKLSESREMLLQLLLHQRKSAERGSNRQLPRHLPDSHTRTLIHRMHRYTQATSLP